MLLASFLHRSARAFRGRHIVRQSHAARPAVDKMFTADHQPIHQQRVPTLAELASEEACAAAKACGYNTFEALLTSGGDDRSMINENTGTNKYHIRPQPVHKEHIFRGSCTGNPPTARGYKAAKNLYESNLLGLEDNELDEALEQIFADQRARIAGILDVPQGAELILCPSGSDAEYIPVAIAKTLHPDARITNGITQLREIGAGSAPASVGRYFSSRGPLTGSISKERQCLVGFEEILGETFSAREKDGSVVGASEKMDEFLQSAFSNLHYPIVHGVFGGKTGLRDSVMPSSLDAGDKSLGVVDACQGRFTSEELRSWLANDALVLFTGSKFFQAPPFCGAVIIPRVIAEKIRSAPQTKRKDLFSNDGLGGFITDKEIPVSFENWASLLKQKNTANVGLALRWEAGLAGMEALASVPGGDQVKAVNEWANTVSKMVDNEPKLDAWCVERSIVSIRVRKSENSWYGMDELRQLYRWMSKDVSNFVPEASLDEKVALSTPAYIGQPVDVSEGHAIVRIALGVESLLSYIDDKDATLASDRLAVQKIAAIANHFKTLEQSGE